MADDIPAPMKPQRASLIGKIKALLAKTVANGCTEAEAMTALEKARALMDDYEINNTDLAFDGEEVEKRSAFVADRERIRARMCAAVGRFCGCCSWSGAFDEIVFCGLASETIFAHWLLDMLADFVGRELVSYLVRTPGIGRVRRIESEAFTIGCCNRISERLDEMAPKSAGLVEARNALIATFMKSSGIALRSSRERRRRVDGSAYDAGESAGDRAQFNRPVDAASVAAIGAPRR